MMIVSQHGIKYLSLYVFFLGGDLEISCFTNLTGDAVNGRTIQLFFEANQDATFVCGLNDATPTACKGGYFQVRT